jgi:hypothetical protein
MMPSQPSFWTLLDAGQPGQELVGDVLAQPRLAEAGAGDFEQPRLTVSGLAVLAITLNGKPRDLRVVDLAQVVPEAGHLQEVSVRIDHLPGHQVVQCGAPQHGFLAAGVHGDVAADAGGIRGSRIHGEHQALGLRRFHDAPGHDARATANRRHGAAHASDWVLLYHAERV